MEGGTSKDNYVLICGATGACNYFSIIGEKRKERGWY